MYFVRIFYLSYWTPLSGSALKVWGGGGGWCVNKLECSSFALCLSWTIMNHIFQFYNKHKSYISMFWDYWIPWKISREDNMYVTRGELFMLDKLCWHSHTQDFLLDFLRYYLKLQTKLAHYKRWPEFKCLCTHGKKMLRKKRWCGGGYFYYRSISIYNEEHNLFNSCDEQQEVIISRSPEGVLTYP